MLPRVTLDMANNLIKWWRTKFLNGYKQFSVIHVDNQEGRVSDTEELLGTGQYRHGFGEAGVPTCSTPPACSHAPTPQPQTQTTDNKHLNLEEFSCDVSMEGGVYRDGQEFSFTLYDFDGHGKITKDDIAGLVTTIYETLGSSVKVPHYGSKTIKVKLTVSPDQRKRMSATVIDHHKSPSHHEHEHEHEHVYDHEPAQEKERENEQEQEQDQEQQQEPEEENKKQPKPKRYVKCRRQKKEYVCCNVNVEGSDADESSEQCSRVSDDDLTEDEGECSDDQLPKYSLREKTKPRRYQYQSPYQHHQQRQRSHNFLPAHPYSAPALCSKARRNKNKSSSLQRKELLEIIQANMDKNNHSFQNTSRKHQYQAHVSNEAEPTCTPVMERKVHRHKHKLPYDGQLQCLANIVNSDNCYLDLATLQDDTHTSPDNHNLYKHVPYCRYDKLLGAVVCMSNRLDKSQLTSSPCRHRRHYRSRSHDLSHVPFRPNLESQNDNKTDKKPKINKVKPCENTEPFKKQVKKFPQVVLGHSSSPHHLKHRNRQEDQARAMAQVVRWLEQEFSSNVNVNNKKESKKKSKCQSQSQSQSSRSRSRSRSRASPIERHEHHHVHEHIHHHYHHYQEAPVVV